MSFPLNRTQMLSLHLHKLVHHLYGTWPGRALGPCTRFPPHQCDSLLQEPGEGLDALVRRAHLVHLGVPKPLAVMEKLIPYYQGNVSRGWSMDNPPDTPGIYMVFGVPWSHLVSLISSAPVQSRSRWLHRPTEREEIESDGRWSRMIGVDLTPGCSRPGAIPSINQPTYSQWSQCAFVNAHL